MKSTLANLIASSIYSASIGSVVILIGILINLIPEYEIHYLPDAIGGAVIFYFISAILSCLLALCIGGVIYIPLKKIYLANYFSASVLGFSVTLVLFGVPNSLENIYWNIAGVITGSIFHYHFKKIVPKVVNEI